MYLHFSELTIMSGGFGQDDGFFQASYDSQTTGYDMGGDAYGGQQAYTQQDT